MTILIEKGNKSWKSITLKNVKSFTATQEFIELHGVVHSQLLLLLESNTNQLTKLFAKFVASVIAKVLAMATSQQHVNSSA